MKTIAKWVTGILTSTLFASSLYADTIRLRADDWCPYNCEPGTDEPGFMVELTRAIFEKAGHTVEYKQLNWARSIKDCRKGEFEGIIGATKEEVEDFIFPEEPQGISGEDFVVKKGDPWRFKDESSFETITLGAIRDYGYGEPIASYIEKNEKNSKKVVFVSGDDVLDRALKMLLKGRINVYVESSWVLKNFLRQNKDFKKDIEIAGSVEPEDIFVAFSPALPKSKEYAKILGDGVKEMRANGELKKLLDRYELSDWK